MRVFPGNKMPRGMNFLWQKEKFHGVLIFLKRQATVKQWSLKKQEEENAARLHSYVFRSSARFLIEPRDNGVFHIDNIDWIR